MAVYTDPRTGETRDVNLGPEVASNSGSSLTGLIILCVAIAFGAWYFFLRTPTTLDVTNTGSPTITEPVTTPDSPNASPTHPAPSPNPGP